LEKLRLYPVSTKCITAGCTGMISECLQARIKRVNITAYGLAKQMVLGILVRSPLQQIWLCFLNWLFKGRSMKDVKNLILKVFVHESIFDPFFVITYMTFLRALDGNSLQRAFEIVKSEFRSAMKAQWSVWPATQLLNFYFVPDDLQLPLMYTIAIFMNAYITYLTKTKMAKP